MNLKTAIYEHLKNDPQIARIVAGRIYRSLAPQGSEFPLLTYQRITSTNKNDIDFTTERLQFDLVGKLEDDDQVEELKEAVIDRLNRFKGDLGGTGFKVKSVWLDIVADDFNEDHSARRIVLDFRFAYLRNEI